MIYLCILAAILSSVAFIHTLPVTIFVLPACFLGVLLPPFEISYKHIDLFHRLMVPAVCVLALMAIFVVHDDHWRSAYMVFTVVYLLSRFVRLLGHAQKRFFKEQKEKNDRLALRLARTKTVEQLQGAHIRERVIIYTTHENEKWFLIMAERFSRHGWNVRIEFLDERASGRFRVVYTAPASQDVLSKSFRAVRTEAVSTEAKG